MVAAVLREIFLCENFATVFDSIAHCILVILWNTVGQTVLIDRFENKGQVLSVLTLAFKF